MTQPTKVIEYVTPVYLEALVKEMGSQKEAADALGLASSTISKNLADGITRTTTELAARYLIENKADKSLRVALMDATQYQALSAIMSAMNVKVVKVK